MEASLSLRGVTATPDAASWVLYSEEGMLLAKGTTNTISGTPIGNMLRCTVTFELPDVPFGDYLVEVECEVDGKTYSTQTPYSVKPDEYESDAVCTIMPSYKFTPEYTGVARLFSGNTQIGGDYNVTAGEPATIDLSAVQPTMYNYNLVIESDEGLQVLRLYYTSPSILSAVQEMRQSMDRLNMQCRLDSLKFTDGNYLDWLRMGMDRFNAFEYSTNFTMTNAQGPFRYYWLLMSQIYALRVSYLENGLTSFNYAGAGVQLDIDVTNFLDAQASAWEAQLEDLRKFKRQLAQSDNTAGDGSMTAVGGNRAKGATGVSFGIVSGRGSLLRVR